MFYEERSRIKQAIDGRKEELRIHRQTLAAFDKMKSALSIDTPDEVLDTIKDAIESRTKAVKQIEQEIRELQNLLDDRYSLKPAA